MYLLVFILGLGVVSAFRGSFPVRRSLSLSVGTVGVAEEQFLAIKQGILDKIIAGATGASPEQKQFIAIFSDFLDGYCTSCCAAGESPEAFKNSVVVLLKAVTSKDPFKFQPFHQAVRTPFDYYKWGNDFMRPLIIKEQSRMLGESNFVKIKEILAKGENVVILSNHQTEADAQVFSILLEEAGMSELGEKSIFIAGHKVTNDPIAIPFSMGRNLICIHSKKHIKNPPEDMPRKSSENLKSMTAMGELMTAGGNLFCKFQCVNSLNITHYYCVGVAPSGGRDRPDPATKQFVVSPFDVKALDMFKLMAMQSKKGVHFFPMAMYTNKLIPPPDTLSSTLGETRNAKRGAVSMHLLDETADMGGFKDK